MIKGVGRIYQQTFIDTYSRIAFAKVYDRKTALVAADTLNDKVLPFFQQHDIPLMRGNKPVKFCLVITKNKNKFVQLKSCIYICNSEVANIIKWDKTYFRQ